MAMFRLLARVAAVLALSSALSGCNLWSRLSSVGDAPDLTPVNDPTAMPNYQPVSLPMPAPQLALRQPNSLWRPGARAFLKDQRAGRVGDILTVSVDISEKGEITNTTARSRKATEDASVARFLGYEASFNRMLPQAINPGNLVDMDSAGNHTGQGSVKRDESIKLMVAAVVTQVLPNGNLAIYGRQEIRVNFEVRELEVRGVIRPEDIGSNNTVRSTQIAEARISYGGRGQITDVQQPRYGQQIFDILFPF